MADHSHLYIPNDSNSLNSGYSTNVTTPQQVYGPQRYIPQTSQWVEPSNSMTAGIMGDQLLHHGLDDGDLDGQYDFDALDPALWQYDGEAQSQQVNHNSTRIQLGGTTVDSHMQSMQSHHNVNSMAALHSRSSSLGGPIEQTNEQAPARQPYFQVFVIPIANQVDGDASIANSNSMFCDFPGVAFRSFLPEGFASPISTTKSPWLVQGTSSRSMSGMGNHVAYQTSPQLQALPSINRSLSSESQGFARSASYGSMMSSYATPDTS